MLFLRALLYLAYFGTVTSGIYCVLVALAAQTFRRRRLAEQSAFVTEALPPLSVLKPLHGAPVGLEENIERHFTQAYPNYEMLFCARTEQDAGLQLAQRIAAKYPHIPSRFLTCGEPQFPNPKMFSLAVMAEAATYEMIVTTDADARLTSDAFQRLVRPFEDNDLMLASCLYLGIPLSKTWTTRLDALGKSVEMSAGCMVANMLSGVDFALGPTMALHKAAYAYAGGYENLGEYWAEDFVLGNRLAEQKRGVQLSSYVIGLTVAPEPFANSFRDQLRWMQSTRRSRPAGHFGTGLTFALPFGVLGMLAGVASGHWKMGVALLLLACLNRVLKSCFVLRALGAPHWVRESWLYPVRDLLGGVLWFCSYLPLRTSYHGGHFDLTPDGRLERIVPKH